MSTTRQPEQPGRIEALRAEVQRLGLAINGASNSAYNQYTALESEAGQIERLSPADADQEIRLAVIRRQMKQLAPARDAEQPARNALCAEQAAASEALRMAESNLALCRQNLAIFDRQTRRICAERDYWRAQTMVDIARLAGGPIIIPEPLDLSSIL
jgi:hypothetical protein